MKISIKLTPCWISLNTKQYKYGQNQNDSDYGVRYVDGNWIAVMLHLVQQS